MSSGFTSRLLWALLLLLLGFGLFVAVGVRQVAVTQEQEALQRLSHGLARHIVGHWPEVTANGEAAQNSRAELLRMLQAVNPGVQVYLLDADGAVAQYIGPPGMVREHRVNIDAVRAFLAGRALPLVGTDPMGGPDRIFSAAMFPPRPGDSRPPGYLYVVLDGPARAAANAGTSPQPAWTSAAWAVAVGMLATLALGSGVLLRLTLPLNRLAKRMHGFGLRQTALPSGLGPEPAAVVAVARPRNEVEAIAHTFDALVQRIEAQAAAREAQASAHREVIANVAHDLRTPLTALHGHLEALGQPATVAQPELHQRLVAVALAQSDKVRRLSQQLFELATLQSSDQVLHRERFRLDELVSDTVQKFELASPQRRVALAGQASGPVDVDGDLHLIERALTNLIDNAVRHTPGTAPVRVSLRCEGPQASVWVEDEGPGLPLELARRLDAGQPVRDPPMPRPGGGMGGLGLAIAQRITALHGGRLHTLGAPGGGTRLVMALPLGEPAA